MARIRVRIRVVDNQKSNKEILECICSYSTVAPVDVFQTHSGAVLLLSSEEELLQPLKREVFEKLKTLGIVPIAPDGYQAQRTVFVARINSFMGDSSVEELIAQFNQENSEFKVLHAYKFSKHASNQVTLKLILETPDAAKLVCQNGFKCFGTRCTPDQISLERFVSVTQRFKCYAFGHTTNKCSSQPTICSICSGEHSFLDCHAKTNPKCVLCNGKHHAVSPICPERKKATQKILDAKKLSNSSKTAPQVPPIMSEDSFPALPGSSRTPRASSTGSNVWTSAPPGVPHSPPNPHLQHTATRFFLTPHVSGVLRRGYDESSTNVHIGQGYSRW